MDVAYRDMRGPKLSQCGSMRGIIIFQLWTVKGTRELSHFLVFWSAPSTCGDLIVCNVHSIEISHVSMQGLERVGHVSD